jgi:hypothetical protein
VAAIALVTEGATLRANSAGTTNISGPACRAAPPRGTLVILGTLSGCSLVPCVATGLARAIRKLARRAPPAMLGIAPAFTTAGLLIQSTTILANPRALAARLAGPSLQWRLAMHPALAVFDGPLNGPPHVIVDGIAQELVERYEGVAVDTARQSSVACVLPTPEISAVDVA